VFNQAQSAIKNLDKGGVFWVKYDEFYGRIRGWEMFLR